MTPVRIISAVALTAAAVGLFFITTDREYINLGPSEGATARIVLDSSRTYEQSFIAARRNLSQIGLYVHPNVANMPDADITVRLLRRDTLLADAHIATSFLDSEGLPTQVRFDPPVAATPGEWLTIYITIPDELSGAVRVQQRLPDDSFRTDNVEFTIDGARQPNPLAYQVFYRYRPPLAVQLGGLVLVAAAVVAFPSLIRQVAPIKLAILTVLLALLYSAPLVLQRTFSAPIFLFAATSFGCMLILLRGRTLEILPAAAGASIFAFSTWFPLHAFAGRQRYIVFALLPALVVALSPGSGMAGRRRWAIMGITVLLATAALVFSPWKASVVLPPVSANPRDVFLDPHQVQATSKLYPALVEGWDHFGSYVGMIAGGLAVLGVLTTARHTWPVLAIGAAGALAALMPALTGFLTPLLPLPPQHLIVLTTFALAYAAAYGLQRLHNFLGRDALATTLTFVIALIALLDLWQVAAVTMESNVI